MGEFPISRDPPEGGTSEQAHQILEKITSRFPISRDPPEGGTPKFTGNRSYRVLMFPISRDPPEGGTAHPNGKTKRV